MARAAGARGGDRRSEPRVRHLRPAADRHHRARGERGHGQDVHDRGAGGALRGRGHAAGPAAAGDVHADGDGRAARPRARAAGLRPSASSRRSRAPAGPTTSCGCSPTAPPRRSSARRARLVRALADFDAATIATTHGFCQEVLSGLGVAGDLEPDATLVEDVGDLLGEVVDDLYVRKYMDDAATPRITRARGDADRARRRSTTRARRSSRATVRRRPAGAARAAGGERAGRARPAQARAVGHHLRRPADAAARRAARASRAAAVARLRERYRVVLVDEFQDTDPIQWEILQRAFGDGGVDAGADRRPETGDLRLPRRRRLLLPGGRPRPRARRATLEVNCRSDQGLIDAYDAMFGGAKLGHEGIVYRHVRARRASVDAVARADGAPLRVRVVDRSDPRSRRPAQGYARLNSAREFVARDLAADLVSRCSARVGRSRPGDVAVLVRTNRHAVLVRDALDDVGDARGHQRRGQRVRHAGGARVAAAAGGAGAPGVARAGARGDDDVVPGLDRRAGRGGRRRRVGGASTAACTRGRRCCAGAGWRR